MPPAVIGMLRRGSLTGRLERAVARRKLWLIALLPVLFVTLRPATAEAYPWMIRHGYAQCASCHTDPTGGETLTSFGRASSEQLLSTRWSERDEPSRASQLLFGLDEPDWLRAGGSFRSLYMATLPRGDDDFDHRLFPMQMDAYGQLRFGRIRVGGSLGAARVPAGSPHARAAQITTDQGDGWNLISRSHWVGYDVADGWLARAGRLNLPFGLRIPEHVMWVREATQTDRESDQQHGVALSYARGRWRGEVMGIAGNYQIAPDEFRQRGYSLFLEYMLSSRTAVGVSSLVTHAQRDALTSSDDAVMRQAHGVTVRTSPVRPLVLMAEANALLRTERDLGYVGYLGADYELVQGLHLMATGEVLDAGASTVPGALTGRGFGEPRLGGWLTVNWFFFTHFDARVDVVMRQDAPVTVLSQLHFYY